MPAIKTFFLSFLLLAALPAQASGPLMRFVAHPIVRAILSSERAAPLRTQALRSGRFDGFIRGEQVRPLVEFIENGGRAGLDTAFQRNFGRIRDRFISALHASPDADPAALLGSIIERSLFIENRTLRFLVDVHPRASRRMRLEFLEASPIPERSHFMMAENWSSSLEARQLMGVDVSGTFIGGLKFNRSDVRFANFTRSQLGTLEARNAELHWSSFLETSLLRPDFHRSALYRTDFSRAEVTGGTFEEANLTAASFQNATLKETSLRRAELFGADMRGATLRDVDLTGVGTRQTRWAEATVDQATLQKSGWDAAEARSLGMRVVD